MKMGKYRQGTWVIIFLMLSAFGAWGQNVIRYDLYVRDTIVNFTGKTRKAISVNGQIPMPTLTFTQGDTAEIYVHNEMDEATSLHWHGVFLPNKEDGVPYLTQLPIAPHTVHVYRFPVIQHGTHWYHSHTEFQEQLGMYGSLIFKKQVNDPTFRKGIDDLPTIPLVLSEWTDYNPNNVDRMLHISTDWFAIKKNATQSYLESIRDGHFKTKLTNEWKRMLAMDVSDIYYNKVLINAKDENRLTQQYKAGDKVRLRIANAGASTYFWLRYAGGKITVVANDGNDVEPVEVDRMLIAVSETYDIVVTIPADSLAFEFMATSEDRTKSASLYLGTGPVQLISPLPKLKYFEGMKMMNGMMKMNGNLKNMGMKMTLNKMDMNAVMYPEITGEKKMKKMGTGIEMQGMDHGSHSADPNNSSNIVTLNYSMLKSPTITTLPKESAVRKFRFELSGNMNRYVWSLNNKVVSETDKILIKKGETVRLVLYNNTMMRHPMHLHGHDFRVLNGQGEYAPLKNVIDLMPMETDTLEFYANEEGDWFFHCHILYHMMSGMGRIFSYENQAPNPLIPNPKYAYRKLKSDDRKFHFMIRNDFESNGNDGAWMIQNTRWNIGTEWRLGYNLSQGFETETHVGRYIGKMQWLMPFVGFDYRYRRLGYNVIQRNLFGQKNSKDNRILATLGVSYVLPMLIVIQFEVFHNGNVRFQIMRDDIPISRRFRLAFMVNTDFEYMVGLRYIITKNIGVRTHYDSDMGFGLGLSLNY